MPFVAPRMDLECPTEWSKSDRERNTLWYGLYVESEKKNTNELIYKTETDS